MKMWDDDPSLSEYQLLRKHGICIKCKKVEAVRGRSLCVACREQNRRLVKARAENLKDSGLCYDCKQPIEAGSNLVRCAACNSKYLRGKQ